MRRATHVIMRSKKVEKMGSAMIRSDGSQIKKIT